MTRPTFDTKCFDLAEHFLPAGTPEFIKNELAEALQTTVEDFIEYGEHNTLLHALASSEPPAGSESTIPDPTL